MRRLFRRLSAAPLAVTLLAVTFQAAGQTVYVAVGDSITAGTGDDSTNATKGYPPRLEALLRNAGQTVTVRNEGVPGENTDEAVLVINEVLGRGGDVLLLMEGSNDVSRQYSAAETLFNLNFLALRAETRGWRVIQATVIPRIPRARIDPENEINQALNQRIRDQAGFEQRSLADPFEVFGRETNLFARFYWKDPLDNVGHPNGAGYDLLARAFFDVITNNDTVAPVLGDTTPRPGALDVNGSRAIELDLWDFGAGLNVTSSRMLVNGTEVNAISEGDTRRLNLTYTPPTPLRGVVRVGLRARDTAPAPNVVDREVFSFIVDGTVFPTGDFDRDGRVDGKDLLQLARAFGARLNDSRFRFAYDLNDDDVVDGGDLALFAANFGRSAS